jgi:hypothetical protein
MIDVVIDGVVTARAAAGPALGGIIGRPTRADEIGRMLEEAWRGSEFYPGGGPAAPRLDVSVRLLLFLPSGQALGASTFVTVSAASRFSCALPIDEAQLAGGFTFSLRCVGVVPDGYSDTGGAGGVLDPADITPGTPGNSPGAQLVALMQERLRNVAVPVSTSGLELFPVTIAPPPGETGRAFREVASALIEFIDEDGHQVGVGVLRGDEDTRAADVRVAPGAPDRRLWFRVRRGTAVQASSPSNLSTLARSVLTDEAGLSHRIAMTRLVRTIGIGTLGAEIAEAAVVTGTPFVYKDLDLDLTDQGRLRVRCKVGLGAEVDGAIVLVAQLGEFEGRYRFGLAESNTAPFDIGELASVVTVESASSSFDWLPGTDLDEFGGQSFTEAVVASTVSEKVVARVRARIADRVEEQTEEALVSVRESLKAFPLAAAAVEESVFVQFNSLDVSVGGIEIVARGGVWEATLELLGADLDCAVSQTAMMTRKRAVMPVARMVQKRLIKKELQPWAEVYARHKGGLARILKANPELAHEVAQAIADGAPVALGLVKSLSPDQRKRAVAIGNAIARASTGELSAVASLAVRLLESHDARTPLFRRAEQLAAELPSPEGRAPS